MRHHLLICIVALGDWIGHHSVIVLIPLLHLVLLDCQHILLAVYVAKLTTCSVGNCPLLLDPLPLFLVTEGCVAIVTHLHIGVNTALILGSE